MNRLRKSAFPNKKIKHGVIGMFLTVAIAVPMHYLHHKSVNSYQNYHLSFSKKNVHKLNNVDFDTLRNYHNKTQGNPIVEDSVRIFKHMPFHKLNKHHYPYKKGINLAQQDNVLPTQLEYLHVFFRNSALNIFIYKRIKFTLKHLATKSIYNPISGIWYKLRMCESGNNYSLNTGNGYYGAYQFALSTWWAIGFTGLPNQASPETQDKAAIELQKISGWIAWPQCAGNLGLLG